MAQCQARVKTCRECEFRFTKEHSELWDCPECGASRRCQRRAVTGYNVCQVHGAGSPKQDREGGRKAKDGLRSQNIPERLLSTYESISSDDRLLELRRDIELVELRINDLLTRVSTGESGDAWKKIDSAHKQLNKAYKINDEDSIRAVMHDLGEVIKEGKTDYKAWDEIFSAIDRRRKLVETERKFLADAQTMISADKLLNIMIATVRIINTVVQSDRQRQLIQKQIETLVLDYDPSKRKWGGSTREKIMAGEDYEGMIEQKMIDSGMTMADIERAKH